MNTFKKPKSKWNLFNLGQKFKALGKRKKNVAYLFADSTLTDSLKSMTETHGIEKQMGSDKIKHKAAALHHVSDFGHVCVYLL